MVNEMRANVKINKTWQGYEIETSDPYTKGYGDRSHLYVFNVYNNQVRWVNDYTHAKHYKSKAYAEALAKKIKEGGVRV